MTRASPFVVEVVRMAGHLLLHHPTSGAFARDAAGYVVDAYDSNATCYCLWGALRASYHALTREYLCDYDERGLYPYILWRVPDWERRDDFMRGSYARRMTRWCGTRPLR